MKLGINNSIWEIKGIKIEEAFTRITDFGFKYVDILALGSANPKLLNAKDKLRIVNSFKKTDLISSNMVTLPPGNIASSELEERRECFSYIKSCADFQSELGGKQILVGNGCGSKTHNMSFEHAWVNSVDFIKRSCDYLYNLNMFLTLELDPSIFFMVNNTYRMLKMIEAVDAPNLFLNIDIGHLAITRESPKELRKLKDYIMHIHISDNDGETHSNGIIGSGVTLVKDYLEELIELKIERVCKKHNEVLAASLELGEIGQDIDDQDCFVSESVKFIQKNIPEISM